LIEFYLNGICNFDTAINLNEALEKINSNSYDIIISDINLGRGNNGIYLIKETRKIDRYKDIPIIAMTAYAMQGDKEVFLQAGSSNYISKPIDRDLFFKMMEYYLHNES
jgi:CheY-like chemotaxis protein